MFQISKAVAHQSRTVQRLQTRRCALAVAALLALTGTPASAASYNWTTGSFNSSGAPNPLPPGDTLTLSTITTTIKQFNGVNFVNDGTVQHQLNGGTVYLSGGATIVNNGLWEEQGTNVFATGNAAGGTFTNQGTYRKSSIGSSTFSTNSLVNNGTIDIQQGTMTFGAGFASNQGVLTGSGAINAIAGINNSGTLAPGSSGAGTLALNGGYTQTAAGTFAVDLTHLASNDLFTITGAANLAGTLALNCLGACSFAVNDSFTILSSGAARSGSFSNVTLNGFATGAFSVNYGANSVSLMVTEDVSPVPETSSWAMLLAGLAVLGWGGATRRRASVTH